MSEPILRAVGLEKRYPSGRSGPVRASSTEAIEALREEPRRSFEAVG